MYVALHHFAVAYFVQCKESLLQNCDRVYSMVPEYIYMTYFFTNFTYKQKKVSILARAGHNFFFIC